MVEWLPGSLLLLPAIIAITRNTAGKEEGDLLLAVVLYALTASLVLLVWPGGVATRYAMPANLPLAVLSGILFDRWWATRPWLIGVSNTIVVGISTSLIVLGWVVMPLAPDAFRQSKISAQTIAAVRGMAAGPLYVLKSNANENVLAYVAAPIRMVSLDEIEKLEVPAFVILSTSQLSEIAAQKPGFRAIPHAVLSKDPLIRIFEVQQK